MHAHVYVLAILAPSVMCAPLPTPTTSRQISTRHDAIETFPFDSDLKAAITQTRARGREASASDALAEERRAYELEALLADPVVVESAGAGGMTAGAEVRAAVEQEVETGVRLPLARLASVPMAVDD